MADITLDLEDVVAEVLQTAVEDSLNKQRKALKKWQRNWPEDQHIIANLKRRIIALDSIHVDLAFKLKRLDDA